MDSKYVLNDLVTMVNNNLRKMTKRSTSNPEQYTELLDFFEESLRNKAKAGSIEQYAIHINMHVKDRTKLYMQKPEEFKRVANSLARPLALSANVSIAMPIRKQLETLEMVSHFLEEFIFTITFFLVLISLIVIYSLMQSDVEERTYEFAMLRTLGLKNTNILIILTIQSFLYSIPGLILGMLINIIC